MTKFIIDTPKDRPCMQILRHPQCFHGYARVTSPCSLPLDNLSYSKPSAIYCCWLQRRAHTHPSGAAGHGRGDEAQRAEVAQVLVDEGLVQVRHVVPLSQLLCALAQLRRVVPASMASAKLLRLHHPCHLFLLPRCRRTLVQIPCCMPCLIRDTLRSRLCHAAPCRLHRQSSKHTLCPCQGHSK